MLISEAKTFVGLVAHVQYRDRAGRDHLELAEIFDVGFVPLYGPCLITDVGEIRLDRVVRCEAQASQKAA